MGCPAAPPARRVRCNSRTVDCRVYGGRADRASRPHLATDPRPSSTRPRAGLPRNSGSICERPCSAPRLPSAFVTEVAACQSDVLVVDALVLSTIHAAQVLAAMSRPVVDWSADLGPKSGTARSSCSTPHQSHVFRSHTDPGGPTSSRREIGSTPRVSGLGLLPGNGFYTQVWSKLLARSRGTPSAGRPAGLDRRPSAVQRSHSR